VSERAAGEQYLSLLACAIVFVWAVGPANFQGVAPLSVLIAAGAMVLLAAVIADRVTAPVVLAFVACAGIALRLNASPWEGSDVYRATAEALATLAQGQNPYTHFFLSTTPPGSPFVYLPGELALYGIQHAIFGSLNDHDRWWGILTLLAMASVGPICGYGRAAVGTAIYAVFQMAIERSLDGSNDTALAFLTVTGCAVLAYASAAAIRGDERNASRLHDASAFILGWALATKALVWFIVPFLVLYVAAPRRRRFLLVALGTLAVFTVPFFVASPAGFVHALTQMVEYHTTIYGLNLWTGLLDTGIPSLAALVPPMVVITVLRVVTLVVVFWAMWRRATTLGFAVLQGTIALGAALFIAAWSTSSYYAYLTAIVIGALPMLGQPAERAA
jgi:hypothetical protein